VTLCCTLLSISAAVFAGDEEPERIERNFDDGRRILFPSSESSTAVGPPAGWRPTVYHMWVLPAAKYSMEFFVSSLAPSNIDR